MKIFLAVSICKILYFIGKQIGKGSSLPGQVVLKMFPDILTRLKLPKNIIAVTGSNGKTSTTELIVHVLKTSGMSVGWNHEGSNQTEGIATLLLRVASFCGVVKCDAIVMECDERYAVKIFEQVKPSILLVTNLCRDQLTRNGHPEFIMDCIRASIVAAGDISKLVLNADDPYVAALTQWKQGEQVGDSLTSQILWFGLCPTSGMKPHVGMYDDGTFCPVCKARMIYKYRIAGHYGSYNCNNCGLKRSDPEIEAAQELRSEAETVLSGVLSLKHGGHPPVKMSVMLPSITGSYNLCAAVAVAEAVGINISDSATALDNYELTCGRTMKLNVANRKGLLLVTKHENTFAYDGALSWITEQHEPCTVIVLVDSISRKYYTSETSWLWDIDFDLLATDKVKNVVLAGRYVYELASRFAMSAVDKVKISHVADLSGLREHVINNTEGDIYTVTCFADKAKLLKELSVES